MTITNRLKITLTPLRLHSASSVRIPNSINNFRTLIPALRLRPLNLLSASSVNLHGLANTSIFHNNLRVMLSPLKSPVLRKYSNPFKRPGMYPSISKCNAKRCNCCMHLCTNSTVTSSVNGRKFSVVNNSDLDWKSIDLNYVLTWKTKNCNMHYVGQTCRALQKRFGEHYRRMKKPKPIDTFLYQHFKLTSFCLPRVPFVNCRQFMYLVISLLVLRAGYGIWLYQFLIIAYLFTLRVIRLMMF